MIYNRCFGYKRYGLHKAKFPAYIEDIFRNGFPKRCHLSIRKQTYGKPHTLRYFLGKHIKSGMMMDWTNAKGYMQVFAQNPGDKGMVHARKAFPATKEIH